VNAFRRYEHGVWSAINCHVSLLDVSSRLGNRRLVECTKQLRLLKHDLTTSGSKLQLTFLPRDAVHSAVDWDWAWFYVCTDTI